MKNPLYPYHYAPEAFKDYRPSAEGKDNLTQQDMGKLCGYVRNVLDADGEAALILIWRFAFGMDCNTIRFYSKAEKSVNGVCEAFRYGCQRFLERQDTISNASLKRVFRMALHDYDIVLLHRQKGVTWLSRNYFESGISIKEIMRCYQQKQFIRLNSTSVSPTECRTLREGDIIRLSRHILNLPVEYGGILLLRYCLQYDIHEIENLLNVSYVNGKIEYLRRALSKHMKFIKPISDSALTKACVRCLENLSIF